MNKTEFHYTWRWHLAASPEALWPFLADTDRFGLDTGLPRLQRKPWPGMEADKQNSKVRNRRYNLHLRRFGVPVEWEEEPFEWIHLQRFGVLRRYRRGPIKEMRIQAVLTPTSDGGTDFVYEVWAKPRGLFGMLAVPGQIGVLSNYSFHRAFKSYGKTAERGGKTVLDLPPRKVELPGNERRIVEIEKRLLRAGIGSTIADPMAKTLVKADDFSLMRLRAYALAEHWGTPRKETLEACLLATRAGVLDLRWDIVCPLCRGPKMVTSHLADIQTQVHCDSCRLDFTADFDRLIELTFRPNASVREIHETEYCVGGPQITPHIVAQQLLASGETRTIALPLEEGRYRIRTAETEGVQTLRSVYGTSTEITVGCKPEGWSREEIEVNPDSRIHLTNSTQTEQLFIMERTAWTDQATTAAEVTAMQTFRDLFSSEALRAGEQVWVGSLAVLFTDLRGSTGLYREMGDAPAFGRVMTHFDLLKQIIAEEDGALVKTIGDAVMAVFRHPASALRAALRAQHKLATPEAGSKLPPLELKAGIHSGPCIAVTLNDRLDYFGTTVNIANRLEGLSSGSDVVISSSMYNNPEVDALLIASSTQLGVEAFDSHLKGYGDDQFELWRVYARSTGKKTFANGVALPADKLLSLSL